PPRSSVTSAVPGWAGGGRGGGGWGCRGAWRARRWGRCWRSWHSASAGAGSREQFPTGPEGVRLPAPCSLLPTFPRCPPRSAPRGSTTGSEEHTSELQSLAYLVCRLLLEKKKIIILTL